MPSRPSTRPRLHQTRRERRGYVLAVTSLAVGAWWLLAVSQTSLGVISPSAAPQPVETAKTDAAEAEYDAAQRTLFSARTHVESARRAVAAAQRDWEESLAARAARESMEAAQSPRAPRRLPAVNPQYSEALAVMQRMVNEREVMLQRLTPEHPDVAAIAMRIASLADEMKTIPQFTVDSESTAREVDERANSNRDLLLPDRGPDLGGGAIGHRMPSARAFASDESGADPDPRQRGPLRPADDSADDSVHQAWDHAQDTLQRCVRAEQQALDRCEELRRQKATAAVSPAVTKIEPPSPLGAAADPPAGSLAVALAILLAVEVVALRTAWGLVGVERSIPLWTVESVAALLPTPVLAVLPTGGKSHAASHSPRQGGQAETSWLVIWLLACEGTLAAAAFIVITLSIRDAGFLIEMVRSPIVTLAKGLRELHS